MQYLVIFTPKQKFRSNEMPSDFPQLLLAEEARAKDLYAERLVRQFWVLGTRNNGAAVLFEAVSYCRSHNPMHLHAVASLPPRQS